MTTGNHEGEVGMTSQRVSGTAVQRTIAVLGSAVFFVVAPFTLAGLVPWSITGWQLRPPFLGLELTRGIGAIMILAGVPGLVDAFARFALQGLGTPAPIFDFDGPQHGREGLGTAHHDEPLAAARQSRPSR